MISEVPIKLKDGVECNEAQFQSLSNLMTRYKALPDDVEIEWGYGALMVKFGGLWIGIEKDGYAHS